MSSWTSLSGIFFEKCEYRLAASALRVRGRRFFALPESHCRAASCTGTETDSRPDVGRRVTAAAGGQASRNVFARRTVKPRNPKCLISGSKPLSFERITQGVLAD